MCDLDLKQHHSAVQTGYAHESLCSMSQSCLALFPVFCHDNPSTSCTEVGVAELASVAVYHLALSSSAYCLYRFKDICKCNSHKWRKGTAVTCNKCRKIYCDLKNMHLSNACFILLIFHWSCRSFAADWNLLQCLWHYRYHMQYSQKFVLLKLL